MSTADSMMVFGGPEEKRLKEAIWLWTRKPLANVPKCPQTWPLAGRWPIGAPSIYQDRVERFGENSPQAQAAAAVLMRRFKEDEAAWEEQYPSWDEVYVDVVRRLSTPLAEPAPEPLQATLPFAEEARA